MRIEIDGTPATVADLYRAATVNYGHFTSMQVRDGAVAGLALHQERLERSSAELFGTAVDGGRARELIRHALDGRPDASVRVTVFLGPDRFDGPPAVLVGVSDPVPEAPAPAWRVRSTRYVRDLARHKNVATMGLIHRHRRAMLDGADDALFVDPGGHVCEGSAWNLALWDGTSVVWPDGEQLAGITMLLQRAALERLGVPSVVRPVPLPDLGGFAGAAAIWSICAAQPVATVDDVGFPGTADLVALLERAWSTVEREPV